MTHIDLPPNPALRRRDKVQEWIENTGWAVTDLYFAKRIPIVAVKGNTVIFVTHHNHGIEEPAKKRKGELAAAAALWVHRHGKSGQTYRWDVAYFHRERADLNPPFHYKEDAWRVSRRRPQEVSKANVWP